jgi:ubiquinol-cytochrome c reductase iron-sulfur subunit
MHSQRHNFISQSTSTSPLPRPISFFIMRQLASTAGALARSCTRQQLPAVRASCSALQQQRSISEVSTSSSFDSPFKGMGSSEKTTNIPSFAKYRNKGGESSSKMFQYFMVGTFGAISALGAKATVQGMRNSMKLSTCPLRRQMRL